MRKAKKVPTRRTRKPKPKFVRSKQPKLFTEEDAARFNVVPPADLAYRWVETENLQRMLNRGWMYVSPQAHPDLPAEGDRIIYLGNVLVCLDRAQAEALDKAQTQKAKDVIGHFYSMLGLPPDSGLTFNGFGDRRTFPILSEHFVATADHPRAGDEDVIVQVTVPFRMTPKWQDIANALKLPHQEYAQRRVLLHLQGAIAGLLLRDDDGEAFQLRQIFLNEVNSNA